VSEDTNMQLVNLLGILQNISVHNDKQGTFPPAKLPRWSLGRRY